MYFMHGLADIDTPPNVSLIFPHYRSLTVTFKTVTFAGASKRTYERVMIIIRFEGTTDLN